MMEADEKNYMKLDDKKEIEQLCSNTWEPLYRYVYFKVQNREEAEDITQETYIKAITYMKKNNIKIDKIIGFLKAVSLNILRDKWRKSKRQGHPINIDDINLVEAAVEDSTEIIGEREIIENALRLLSDEQRLVIELRIIKGYSVADTAKKMDKTEGNIRVLQYRGLQRLSKLFKNEF